MSQTCKSCGKSIEILNHERTGKPAPIESEPVPNGNVTLNADGTYHVVKKDETVPESQLRYVNHYTNCPQAGSWREQTKQQEEGK